MITIDLCGDKIIIENYQGNEEYILAMFTYLKGLVDPNSEVVINDIVKDILKGIHYDG